MAVFAKDGETSLRQAAYALAPRRVVGRELSDEAQYLAVYRRAATLPAGAAALPGGFLLKR